LSASSRLCFLRFLSRLFRFLLFLSRRELSEKSEESVEEEEESEEESEESAEDESEELGDSRATAACAGAGTAGVAGDASAGGVGGSVGAPVCCSSANVCTHMGGLSSIVCSSTHFDSDMMIADRTAFAFASGFLKNCIDFTSSVCDIAQKKSYMNMENRLMHSLSSFFDVCVMSVLAAEQMAADLYISIMFGICCVMWFACARHVC
jgi:hypothetical protein